MITACLMEWRIHMDSVILSLGVSIQKISMLIPLDTYSFFIHSSFIIHYSFPVEHHTCIKIEILIKSKRYEIVC
jgi:hypothetical protein